MTTATRQRGVMEWLQTMALCILFPMLAWLGQAVISMTEALAVLNVTVQTVALNVEILDRVKVDDRVYQVHRELIKKDLDALGRRLDNANKRLDVYGIERGKK